MTTPTLFSLLPDGSEPRVERLECLTDVQVGRNGTEHCTALRAFPRLGYSSRYVMLGTAKSQLAPLMAGEPVLLPLSQHRLEGNGTAPTIDALFGAGTTARYLITNSLGLSRVVSGEGGGVVPGWQQNDVYAVPLAEATLTEDSFTVEAVSANARVSNLSFLVQGIDEQSLMNALPPIDTDLAGIPLMPSAFKHDWTANPTEQAQFSVNRFDAGHLATRKVRYAKRQVSVSLLLRDRAAIMLFRRFCYAIKGRATPFYFQAPQDSVPRLYRFADDTVEIAYLRPSLAQVKLNLVETQ